MVVMKERAVILATAMVVVLTVVVMCGRGGGGEVITASSSSSTAANSGGHKAPALHSRFTKPIREYTIEPPSNTPEQKRNNLKKIVITGGAGFIGSQLGHHLHQKGHPVVLIDNLEYGYRDNLEVDGKKFGSFILGDVLDPRIWEYLKDTDALFHFAALSALPVCQNQPQKATEVNVAGTAAMLEAARIHGVRRFLFASTSAVYEENTGTLSEDQHVTPHLLYSATKQQSEIIVRGYDKVYDLDTVILRFFNVYGPHQDFRRKSPPFTSYIVRELAYGRAPVLHSSGDQSRDYIYLDDLMRLVTSAMDVPAARGQTFNVASGKSHSVKEMYGIVAKLLQKENISPIYHTAGDFWKAYPELFQGAKPIQRSILEKEVNKNVLGNNNKAKEILGWEPKVSMEEGLQEMVKFIKGKQKDGTMAAQFDTAWSSPSSSTKQQK